VRFAPVVPALAIAALAACASVGAKQFGQYASISPRVAGAANERVPLHVTVDLGQSANVAVFYVIPGRGATLLFPSDSTMSGFLEAGSHPLTTALTKELMSGDSSRLVRLPTNTRTPTSSRGRSGFPNDTSRLGADRFSLAVRGMLLVYASQEPLSYAALKTKVIGISIPMEDTEALNTVTKLIHATTKGGQPWAAYSTEFNP
jgi:hypothetical protein